MVSQTRCCHPGSFAGMLKFKMGQDGQGYSHFGLTGGPVKVKEGQSKIFEKYPQIVVVHGPKTGLCHLEMNIFYSFS